MAVQGFQIDPNIFRLLSGASQLAGLNGGQGGSLNQADPSVAMQVTQGQSNTPAATPTVTPEQQKILDGANAPSLAPQKAALQEQRNIESQNPQLMQQNPQQQQQAQNTPGGMEPQQSALGNFSQEQMQQGQQGAQTNSERGFWQGLAANLSGEGLQGDALNDWRKNMSLGTALGMLGNAIGGQTTGGRLGEGVYQLGAGAMASKNSELREGQQQNFMQAALNALTGRTPTTQAATQNQTQGSTMTQSSANQPSMPNGESSLAGEMKSITDEYNGILDRLNRLNGIR